MRFIQIKLPKKIKRKLPNTAKRRKALADHDAWLTKLGLDLKSLKKTTTAVKTDQLVKYSTDRMLGKIDWEKKSKVLN